MSVACKAYWIFLLHKLVELFPTAKFVLTIRDPLSWVDSFINHQLAHSASEKWLAFRDWKFAPAMVGDRARCVETEIPIEIRP